MFENISIGIRTFLRDDKLFHVIDNVRRMLPGAQMIIADCGEMTEQKDSLYAELEREGHIHIDLPFDSGFGRMSNAIADALQRPYLLIASDDFDFSPPEVSEGISSLEYALAYSKYVNVDIASGRVNNNPYEFYLEEKDGVVQEIPVDVDKISYWEGQKCLPSIFTVVDLTVNYSLIKNHVVKQIRWDDDVKIGGGEHAAFFLDCKKAGFRTVYVRDANITEQTGRDSARYRMYRRRAMDPARPCFVKRGIRRYVLGNGTVDWES